MRRIDILHSIDALREALDSSTMNDALRSVFTSRGEGKRGSILPQLNAYSILATRFDEATLSLVDIFGLQILADATHWNDLLDTQHSPLAQELYRRVVAAQTSLPLFARLLKQKGETEYLNALPEAQRARNGVGMISVILLESEREFSRPERLIELLQAVTELYQGLAKMLGESPDDLTVLSCDSGSDKSFDFLGAAIVVEEVKAVIIALWDRTVYFGTKLRELKLDAIIKSLPVFERVDDMKASRHLGPEQAEIIRRQIDGGIRKFVHAGATIPEINAHTHHEPRALLSPEKKLLMPPSPADTPPPPPPADPEADRNPERDVMSEMLARLEKMEKQQTKATAKPGKRRTKKVI